jgi:hypothetical protein
LPFGYLRWMRPAKFAVLALVVVALSGCVPAPTPVVPTAPPTPAATPVFASNAQALAAAKAAFTGYLAVSDAIAASGGRKPERISRWVAPVDRPAELSAFADLSKSGNRLTGATKFFGLKIQRIEQSVSGIVTLDAYVCDDVSGTRLINASGKDVTPSSREDVIPLQAHFTSASAGSPILLVEGSEPWSGTDFCTSRG